VGASECRKQMISTPRNPETKNELPSLNKLMRKQSLFRLTAGALLLLVMPAARADYSNTVASFHPIGYWPLNETVAPGAAITTATNLGTLGSALNGTFQGNVTFGVPSALASDSDTADGFDGATAQAQTPYTAAALSNAPSFT